MYFCCRFSFANCAGHVLQPPWVAPVFGIPAIPAGNTGIITYTLISTSTPLGSSNFIRASMVLEEEL